MANEIRVTTTLNYNKNGLNLTGSNQFSLTQVGTNTEAHTQTITTGSWNTLSFGSLGDVRYLYLENLDTTNYVEVATDNAGAKIFAKLRAGDSMLLPMETLTVYAKANTASVNVSLFAVET